MRVLNARTFLDNDQGTAWLHFDVRHGRFASVRRTAKAEQLPAGTATLASWTDADRQGAVVIVAAGAFLVPAGLDVHVHSRDPGLTHKETWQTLAAGAWRGGVVAVGDMPNTIPPTMTREAVLQKAAIASKSGLQFAFFLGVGVGNIDQVAGLLSDPELPICGLKVFYGKTTGELVYDDLETLARSLPASGDKIIVFHSEDQCTIECNYRALPQSDADALTRRDNAAFRVHSQIRSSSAAHESTRAILDWGLASYRRPIHIAHCSTPVEVEMVMEYRARGLPVTTEVAPHHLLLSTDDYERLGPLAKMNPPLRSPQEVEALRRHVGAGHVEVYATDHAPHTRAEKFVEVAKSPSGVPAVELYYPLLFEIARVTGLSPAKAVTMAATRPAELFGFKDQGRIADGFVADCAWLSDAPFTVRGEETVSKCGWTPYDGWQLPRDVLGTWNRGRRVYSGR
jgi:dihydroorotase